MISKEQGRLVWRCRRGALELDVLLREFLATHYALLSASEQQVFDRLLDHPDPELMDWLLGRQIPKEAGIANLVGKIRQHTSNTNSRHALSE